MSLIMSIEINVSSCLCQVIMWKFACFWKGLINRNLHGLYFFEDLIDLMELPIKLKYVYSNAECMRDGLLEDWLYLHVACMTYYLRVDSQLSTLLLCSSRFHLHYSYHWRTDCTGCYPLDHVASYQSGCYVDICRNCEMRASEYLRRMTLWNLLIDHIYIFKDDSNVLYVWSISWR